MKNTEYYECIVIFNVNVIDEYDTLFIQVKFNACYGELKEGLSNMKYSNSLVVYSIRCLQEYKG